MMLYLYGASGHAKVVLEIAECLGKSIAGLIDLNPGIQEVFGYPVTNQLSDSYIARGQEIFISIGNNATRQKIVYSIHHAGVVFPVLIHPAANISKRADIGPGTVVMAGVTLNADVSVGAHCIINTNSSIDHDCVIGDFVHVSPNVALAGAVEVGEGSHIGIGSSVIQGIKIGKWCTVGAGAVIIKDIPDGSTVVGNPGRIITKKA